MISILRPSLVYTDISPDICEHDEDMDAEEWSYDGRSVYRGSLDLSYKNYDIDVFWLYDDSSNRVGLAEHEPSDNTVFKTLWIQDNVYGSLLQEDWENTDKTIWSLMSEESYQDHLRLNTSQLALKSFGKIIIPEYLLKGVPEVYHCEKCNKTSLLPLTCNDAVKKRLPVTADSFFIDESFVLFKPCSDSIVFNWLCGDVHRPVIRDEQVRQQRESVPPLDSPELPQQEVPPEQPVPPLEKTDLQQLVVTEETPEQT